ncbi:MAG: GNAT family N-acetyltransferase [Lachnospiraceae bacterium]
MEQTTKKQNTIQYRTIQPSDYEALEKIICDTWNYEKICNQKTAKILSKVFLASCLTNQTFTCVALKQDIPVGIIMGKNEKTHHMQIRYAWRQFAAIVEILVRKEGRRVLKIFEMFKHINQDLYRESGKEFDGELAFFAIDSRARGAGVGKELFHRLQNYMQSQNISDFYLYTDITCNYGFYEHQGMRRMCEKKYSPAAYTNKEMSFFLYAYEG